MAAVVVALTSFFLSLAAAAAVGADTVGGAPEVARGAVADGTADGATGAVVTVGAATADCAGFGTGAEGMGADATAASGGFDSADAVTVTGGGAVMDADDAGADGGGASAAGGLSGFIAEIEVKINRAPPAVLVCWIS